MSYAARVLEAGPFAYWRLNEPSGTSVADQSGNGNTGTIAGGVTLNQTGVLTSGDKAADFNGTTGRITIPDPATSLAGDLTLELWLKLDTLPRTTVLSKSSAREFELTIETTGNVNFYNGDLTTTNNVASPVGLVTTGAWIHLVVVRNVATKSITWYKNGAKFAGPTPYGTIVPTDSVNGIVIGSTPTSTQFVDGLLDEIAIYTRQLADYEVADHYLARLDRAELFAVTINGTARTAKIYVPDGSGAFTGELLAGARGSARLSLYDLLGATGYRPAIDDVVSVVYGATQVWGGYADDTNEGPFLNDEMDTGVKTDISVSDWHALAERVDYVGSFTAGTSLRTAMTTILTDSGLGAFGVTLDAAAFGSLANGPLLTSTTSFDGTVLEAFNKLQTLTGYLWRIDPSKVLKSRQPGFESCGFSLSDADTSPGVIGPVRVRQQRNTNYVNRVRLTCGPSGPGDPIAHSWAGNGVATVFTLHNQDVPASNVWPGVVNVDGANYPLWPPAGAPANAIIWDYATNDGTLTFTGTSAAIATGATTITLTYTPMFPFVVTYEDATDVQLPPVGHGPYAMRASAPEILNYAEGYATAQSFVRVGLAAPKVVTVRTDKGPAYPGQSIALAFAARNVAATYMVTGCAMEMAEDGALEYVLTCVSGTELGESWLDFFTGRSASSGGGTIVSSGGTTGGSATVVTAPIYLGGSRSVGNLSAATTFKQVPSYLVFVATATTSLNLRSWVASKTGTVTVRLYDETAAAAVASSVSAPITSVYPAFTEVTATVAVVAGHRYRLELAGSVTDTGVYGIGQLEGL